MNQRSFGRASGEARPLSIGFDQFGYADASVLLCLGGTKVLVSVTLQQGVPHFLKGQGIGWLTAEYAMLPFATQQRTQRESTAVQRNGRNVEISRLIGRALRSVVSCELLGERTIYIDCDVLQADGSTRVACVTAASIALQRAIQRWIAEGIIKQSIMQSPIAGISVGVATNGEVFVDLDQKEDNEIQADFNFVMTPSMQIVEIQGTAEKMPIAWDQIDRLKLSAFEALRTIFAAADKALEEAPVNTNPLALDFKKSGGSRHKQKEEIRPHKPALFSLANRL